MFHSVRTPRTIAGRSAWIVSAMSFPRCPEQAVANPVGSRDERAYCNGHRCPFRLSIIALTTGVASLIAALTSASQFPVGGPVFTRMGDGLFGADGRSIVILARLLVIQPICPAGQDVCGQVSHRQSLPRGQSGPGVRTSESSWQLRLPSASRFFSTQTQSYSFPSAGGSELAHTPPHAWQRLAYAYTSIHLLPQ